MDTPPPGPRWSGHPFTEADTAAVMDFFTEADFFFRTAEPDTLSQAEVLALLADDTHVLVADGEPVGLYAVESPPMGRDHYCHFHLNFRLRADAPQQWWASAYHEVVQSVRWRTEVIRLAVLFGEFDERGLAAARAIGLTDEGTLANTVVRGGQRYGYVYFSQIWAVS